MSFFDSLFGKQPKDTPQNALDWNALTDLKQLEEIRTASASLPVAIFKNSTRCGISRMAFRTFEKEFSLSASQMQLYLLDVLEHRPVSNAVAQEFGVGHESPQLLLLRDGKVVYHESHGAISAKELERFK